MEVSIPDTVSLFTQTPRKVGFDWGHYCFRHAVLRAINGEDIKIKLEDAYMAGCDDCEAERDAS